MKLLIVSLLSLLVFTGCTVAAVEVVTTGVGQGYAGEVKVEVTMKGDKITAIEVLESSDTPGLSTQAFEVMIERVIAKNGVDVDIVAGATGSSDGILEAIKDALGKNK